MPEGAQILTIAEQNGKTCLWALVDPEAPTCRRTFIMIGTGHQIEGSALTFLGSVQLLAGMLILHVFEEHQTS